jgi:hypothetical protein
VPVEFDESILSHGIGCPRFSHGCHGEPQLGCGHFVPVATFSTACPHEDKSNLGAFGDEFTFELSQAAKMPKTSLPAGLIVSIEAPFPDNRQFGSNPQKMQFCPGRRQTAR